MQKQHLSELWEKVNGMIRQELTQVSFDTWIRNLEPVSYENNKIIFKVPNEFSKSILQNRYSNLIATAIRTCINEVVEVEYVAENGGYVKEIENMVIDNQLKSAVEMRKLAEDVRQRSVDVDERVKQHIINISKHVEYSSNRGETEVRVILSNERDKQDEIFEKVLKEIQNKGYTAELDNDDFPHIKLSW